MSFSKLFAASSKLNLTKSKVAGCLAVSAFAAYSIKKLYIGKHGLVSTAEDNAIAPDSFTSGDGSKVGKDGAKIESISVNRLFYAQLRALLKITIPGVWTKEFFLIVVHTFALISRTFLSIYVAQLDGLIVKAIVQKDVKQFLITLSLWLGIAIPATFVNSLIRFLESKLGLVLRTRLIEHAYQLYFKVISAEYGRIWLRSTCSGFIISILKISFHF